MCTNTCECNLTLRCKDLHEMNKQAMLVAGTYSQCRSVQVQTPVLQLLAGLCIVVDTVHKLLHCGQALVRGAACVGTQVLSTPYMSRWKHTDPSKSNTHQSKTAYTGTCSKQRIAASVMSAKRFLKIPETNLKNFSQCSFIFLVPNLQPTDLKNAPSLACYKSQLKMYLFHQAFN